MDKKLLEELRLKINKIDKSMVGLLDDRAECVKEIGEYKKENNIPIYQPDREKIVKKRVLDASRKIFPTDALMHIYTEIVSAARSLEEPLDIGFLGPEGSFTEQSAIKQFGSSVMLHAMPTIPDIFREVENGKVHYGVVPIENSVGGTVNITLDEFVDSPVQIVGENHLIIHQNLLANTDDLNEIKRIYSHPQSFSQCRIWLETNLPNVDRIEVSSNSKAALMVSEDKFSAALAGANAADKYGINIVQRNIEDNPENTTRFWIIAGPEQVIDKPDKTSILVSVKNSPGALLKLLSPFQVFDINMSKIESRPSQRRPWDYLFFIDIDGSINSASVKKALDKVREDVVFLKVIGSYNKSLR